MDLDLNTITQLAAVADPEAYGKSAGKAIREFKEETSTPAKQVPGSTPEPTEPTTIVDSDPGTRA